MEENNTVDKKESLRDRLGKIEDKLEEILPSENPKGFKKFKLPWRGRVSKKKVSRGWCGVIYIGHNKSVKFTKVPITDSVIELDGVPHNVLPHHILNYRNRMPLIIQTAWGQEPFNPEGNFKEVQEANMGSEGWRFIQAYLEAQAVKDKKKFGAGAIIFGILIVAGIAYYAYKSGAFG